jgi:predicted metalloprotease with PDZ domain
MKRIVVFVLAISAAGVGRASPGPVPVAASSTIPPARDVPYPGTLKLVVDTTDTLHRVFRVHEELPVAAAGDLVLLYPRWLPGVHAPEGPIDRLAGLIVASRGARIAWTRDVLDPFAFHVPVPPGVTSITVDFTYLSPVGRQVGRQEVGRELLVLDWDSVVLYPAGYFTRQIPTQATVRVPDGWRVACALDAASTVGATTTFKPVALETLVDSPLHAGRHYKRHDLAPGDRTPVALELMADRADLVELEPKVVDLYRNLVQQAYRLFGSKHYDHYSFLLELSDEVGGDTTLEHHRSAEYAEPVDALADWDKTSAGRDVIAHEFVHSWDGKFRRPADLWTPDYNTPMRDSLLWVYEGGTSYWGEVLTARAGMWSKDQALDELAGNVAQMQAQTGRTWRPLQDTTNDELINPRRPMSWPSWQRFEDYYIEGGLIWLDADTLIRENSGGKQSLDDFARTMFGGHDGSYVPVTYTFEDVVKALDGVLPYDWATFLRSRLDAVGKVPLDGIARGGYKLVFTSTPGEYWKSVEDFRLKGVNHSYSLGIVVDKDAAVTYVAWDSPAAKAGVTVGMKLVAVDGLAYEAGRLTKAIERSAKTRAPLELIVSQGEVFRTARVDYHGGLRYPHLVRDPAKPALLDEIFAPRPR